jgi:RHS repeat-associated protein
MFFDNLVVQHYTGPLTEENVYYPFGLKMAGISSNAAGRLENKKKYNGYEENKTFDLNWYETFYRTHDPQIGRFWQIDPKPTDFESLYAAMGNNPILNFDILGDTIPIKTGRTGAEGQADISAFCGYLASVTGNTYDVVDGKLKRTNDILNTKTDGNVSGDLSELIEGMITRKKNTPMTLENSDIADRGTTFDIAASGRIDLRDFLKVKDHIFLAMLITHIFDEHKRLPSDLGKRTKALIHDAHEKAKVTEASFGSKMSGVTLSSRKEHWGDPIQLTQTIIVYPYTFDYGSIKYEMQLQQVKEARGVILYPHPSGIIIDLFKKR